MGDPRFRASVDVRFRNGGTTAENGDQLFQQIKTVLPPPAWQRFEDLRKRCVSLNKLAEQFRGPGAKTEATMPDGTTASATVLLSIKDADHFVVRSTDRIVAGAEEPDFELVIARKPPQPGAKAPASK